MKLDRLMSIVLILLDKERISAQELADMFEVSLRTIYRDLDAIDLAGVPIRSISGVNGGFEIMPNYKIDRKVFLPTDLTAILMGLSSLSDMIKGDELINALAKVKSLIPPEKADEIELNVSQIHIDLNQWMGTRNIQSNLAMIKIALQNSKMLVFQYIAHHGDQTNRRVEPCQLVWKSSHWYLYGYCHKRMDFRLFRLSRMMNLQIIEETFQLRDYQKPQLEFADTLTAMQTEIKIRIHHSIMDRVLEYCTYDCFTLEDEEHYLVSFPFIENDYHYDILLSFANKCECLAPNHIRAEMKRRIHNIISLYDD